MKIGKKRRDDLAVGGLSKPVINESKRSTLIIGLVVVTIVLVVWVAFMGMKAQSTIEVAMVNEPIIKNQPVTAEMFVKYNMLEAEYEKLSIVNDDGVKKRRVILWSELDKILGGFAAYPLQTGQYAEYRSFIKSRVDNSDSVLYSFPGKDVIPLDIGQAEMKQFKTLLQPGDRLNIQALFTERTVVDVPDGYGGFTKQDVEAFKTETVFNDIMVADMFNAQGESILDIYAGYNDMTVWQQAQMDSSESFKERTEPASLMIALTSEEKDRYFQYKSKQGVQFKVSMPQRTE